LDKGADVNTKEPWGDTALMKAAGRGHLDVMKALIGLGANVNAGNEGGQTPVILAVENGNVEAVRLLLEKGADVTARSGRTALKIAREKGREAIVEILRAHGAKD